MLSQLLLPKQLNIYVIFLLIHYFFFFCSEEGDNFTPSVDMALTPDMVSAQFTVIDPKVPTEEKVTP